MTHAQVAPSNLPSLLLVVVSAVRIFWCNPSQDR